MDMDNLPSNVRWWLEGIASEIKALGDIQAKTGFRHVCGEVVESLLTLSVAASCSGSVGRLYHLYQ